MAKASSFKAFLLLRCVTESIYVRDVWWSIRSRVANESCHPSDRIDSSVLYWNCGVAVGGICFSRAKKEQQRGMTVRCI
jgi:hypothetical protein